MASGLPIFRMRNTFLGRNWNGKFHSVVGDCIGDDTFVVRYVGVLGSADDELDGVTRVEIAGDVASDADWSGVGVYVAT